MKGGLVEEVALLAKAARSGGILDWKSWIPFRSGYRSNDGEIRVA
jgi:hypothetical protein